MAPLLILGGTGLANILVERLREAYPEVGLILSLAGRTRRPQLPSGPASCEVRSGGFGGADGLAGYLKARGIAALVDATHPYAANISAHAAAAAVRAGIPSLHLLRPPWLREADDLWHPVPDHAGAVAALEERGKARRLTVFLAIGRQDAGFYGALKGCDLVLRAVERPDMAALPTGTRLVLARGPFDMAAETAFLREHGIDILVSKNSGGAATRGKILAARRLRIPVLMLERPPMPPPAPHGRVVHRVEEAVQWVSQLLPLRI